ncbi:MAG TPA: hypothetical protein PLD88_07710, partial [Candidatus Berkiella sp.]|nr:hypothetical protein [Candidatus Berkiella sp.]
MYPKLFDERTLKFFQDYQKICTNPQLIWSEWFNTYQLYHKWFIELAEKPQAVSLLPEQVYQEWGRLLNEFQQKISGLPVSVVITEDKRFSDANWQEHPLFYFYHQAYLLWVKQSMQWIEDHG